MDFMVILWNLLVILMIEMRILNIAYIHFGFLNLKIHNKFIKYIF